MKRLLLSISCMASYACIGEATTSEPSWQHPEYGIVKADHPSYRAAYEKCDVQVYGAGLEIAGTTYFTKKEVFAQVRPLLTKQRTKAETALLSVWAEEWQPAFIACIANEGFVFNED